MGTKCFMGLHGNLQWKPCKTMGRLYMQWGASACEARDTGTLCTLAASVGRWNKLNPKRD